MQIANKNIRLRQKMFKPIAKAWKEKFEKKEEINNKIETGEQVDIQQ